MKLPHVIVVGTDFSVQAEAALRSALELAKKLGARVHLVYGWTLPTTITPMELPAPFTGSLAEQLQGDANKAMQQTIERHRDANVELDGVVLVNDARDAIIGEATRLSAELIVVGTHGRRGLRRAVIGSVAEGVVRAAPCSVLVVR